MRKNKKKRKKIPLLQSIFIPLLAVTILHAVIFYGAIAVTDTINGFNANSESQLNQSAVQCATYIETEMNSKWNNISGLSAAASKHIDEIITGYHINAKHFLNSEKYTSDFLLDISDDMLASLRINSANGIFIVLANDDSKPDRNSDGSFKGIYFSDNDSQDTPSDYSDIVMVRGPSYVAEEYSIPLDISWMNKYKYVAADKNMEYFFKPMAAAYTYPLNNAENLGYWSRPFYFSSGNYYESELIVTYSEPIVYKGTVLGTVGIAVSLAVKENCDFLNIDYDKYLEKVKRHGCYKSDKQRKVGFDHPSKASEYIYKPVEFGVQKNLHMLETTAPGVAVWSCYISDEKSKDAEIIFSKMMSAKTDLEKYNCAICLGIMKDLRCLDVLRDIIVNRDNFLFTDCRRTNQFRTSIAICLLGRLGSKDDIALLEKIVFSEKEFENPMYKSDKVTINGYHNPVYFDVFTHACMSLVKLCKAHNTDMVSLHRRFLKLFDEDKIIKRVTSAQYGNPEFMEIYDFQQHILKITYNKSKNTCKNI